MMQDILITATEGFVDRYDSQLADSDPQTMRDVAQVIADWQLAASEHFSVLHGDYRLDNLLFPPSGDEVVAVDWQTAAVGPPVRDVSYFLGTSLESGARRGERGGAARRVPRCSHRVRRTSTTPPDRCWDDYRLGHLQGPLITSSAACTPRARGATGPMPCSSPWPGVRVRRSETCARSSCCEVEPAGAAPPLVTTCQPVGAIPSPGRMMAANASSSRLHRDFRRCAWLTSRLGGGIRRRSG